MQTPSPWATKADVEAAREALKADIAALHADLRAVQALLTDQQTRRSWWRRLFTAGAVVAAVMAVSGEAWATVAEYIHGDTLYEKCASTAIGPQAAADQAFCNGYVSAIADAAAEGRFNDAPFCVDHVASGQLADVVRRYLKAHPELQHNYGAPGLVARALFEAFPCRK